MSTIEIRRVNPLEHAEALKALFLAHDRPWYPAFFDRAYPEAVRQGASSWVGWDTDGRVVMHIALFPHALVGRDGDVRGGLLVNLMVAREHRGLFPALRLLRRLMDDTAAEQRLDFLYADPNEPARAVLRAAGFVPGGSLARFVMPLGHRQPLVRLGVRLYHAAQRARRPVPLLAAQAEPAAATDVAAFARPPGDSPRLRPVHPPELYRRRLAGYPSATDRWWTFSAGAGRPPVAAALVRGPDEDGRAVLTSLWRDPSVRLASLVPTLVRTLREGGCLSLQTWTLVESSFAREVRGVGFVCRGDYAPLALYPFTPAGRDAVVRAADWEITDIDCDR